MLKKLRTYQWKRILLLAVGVPFVLYFLWTTAHFVIAYQETQHVHIFPTDVQADGWNDSAQVKIQDLPPDAPFTSFSKNNSAYIELAASTSSALNTSPEIHLPGLQATSTIFATSTLQTSTSTSLGTSTSTLPLEDETSSTTSEASSTGGTILESAPIFPELFRDWDTGDATSGERELLLPDTNEDSTEDGASTTQTLPLPLFIELQEEGTTSTGTIATTTSSSLDVALPFALSAVEDLGQFLLSQIFETAYATTTPVSVFSSTSVETSTPAISNPPPVHHDVGTDTTSVSTCMIVGTECHTMQFSGFGVSGSLTEKEFNGAQVNFSFAADTLDTGLTDGKLYVRYFHDGLWRTAGEVYVNERLSNEKNGGYFSSTLDDLHTWEDFDDLKIEVEFVRGDEGAPMLLYFDALWVDAIFKDRVQDILSGHTGGALTDAPENVSQQLRDVDPNNNSLVFPDGSNVAFEYASDLSDTLLMRADRPSYKGGVGASDTAYVSVTNTGSEQDSFVLNAAFPGGAGSMLDLQQYLRNVATTTPEPMREDVTYFCEVGWQGNPGGRYHCPDENEDEHMCSSVNVSGQGCFVANDIIGTHEQVKYIDAWVQGGIENTANGGSPPGFEDFRISSRSAKAYEILPGQTLYFKVRIASPQSGPAKFVLLAAGNSYAGDIAAASLQNEAWFKAQHPVVKKEVSGGHGNTLVSNISEFNGDEKPEFHFTFKSKRGLISKLFNAVNGTGNQFSVSKVALARMDGERADVPVAVEYGKNGEWSMQIKNQPRAFRPGKYIVDVTMKDGADTFTESVEFYWGVLVLNLNTSSYRPGENISLMMGALDEKGDTLCNADLRLSITAPNGAASDVPVNQSQLCGMNNVVETADYLAEYAAAESGNYTIELVQYDDMGNAKHRITDSFTVTQDAPFTIRRAGATRIYPVADYSMDIDVTASEDFDGEFIEPIPQDFTLIDDGGAEIRMYGSAKNLAWPVSLKAGETQHVRYVYDAPDISPYTYALGPAEVHAATGLPFSEGRQWKLASDATGNMLLYWDQTFIPSGWTCVSCQPSDPFYQRFVVGSSTAGLNGGAATHTHTASGSVNASAGSQGVDTNTVGTPVVGHTHTYTPVISSASNLPAYRQLAIIQYNSIGEPPSLPTGAIAIFDVASSSLPVGWFRYNKQDGNFVRSESTSTIGTTGGSNTHTHTITGNTGAAASTVNTRNPGTTVSVAAAAHTHSVNSVTASANSQPPYVEVLLARVTATTTPPDTMIAMWSGDPGTGWTVLSSSSQTFENRFIKASTTYGLLGGAATGTHANVTGIVSGAPSATANRDSAPVNTTVASAAHTHTVDVTNFSIADIEPPYRTAVFAKRSGGQVPDAPTLYGVLFDNEKMGTSSPAFEFSASDPVGTTNIVYEFQYDDDADLDSSPIADRTSDVETGCSPNCFQNLITPADTSPFNEAERVRVTIQSTLTPGETYYWRVRAKKNASVDWGAWATTTSFTYVPNISPSQWFQTDDAQFDTDTLTGAETYGANSVRLTTAPTTEVLVAYGEGTVQTPRYRLWDGAAWGSENSALSVGGTIQWVATAAGTTRDEYILGTQDASNDVNVQVFNGTTDTWGNLQEVTASVANNQDRGFDIAYESQSGRAIVVYCDGDADPSYRIWNGTSWSGATTVNIASANNCEWIKLASNPISDEITLVERDTGAVYEAQVWNGTSWGNSKTLGSMNEVAHEGIAVEYEDSGNQVVVAVSNGLTSGFVWSTWDGAAWSVTATQALGDDFEWGTLRRDVGTDVMTLCYIDEDSDIGALTWDGNTWATFVAGTNEREGTGNGNDGRPVDCVYETTAGRDGFVMLPYSDTTNGRYQYFNGISWTGEASISTITDSWTAGTVRGGDGTIHAFFHDDVNGQFDVSSWNGSAWAAAQTLEPTPSVTATPFRQPIDMAAKTFESNTGTITGTTINFTAVPGRSTWGEVSWKTTEPSGSDVKLQVYYDNGGGTCSTLVPETPGTGLPGNGTSPGQGFDVSSSPLNLSGLSTSTYSRICLRATMTTGGSNIPTLDEWTVTWQRQSLLQQEHFRWYANAVASLNPTDPWPIGIVDLGEDTAIPTANAPVIGEVFRLRMSLLASSSALSVNTIALKLQYAAGSSCSASMNWQDVGAIGSTTAAWRGFDNAALTDGATLSSVLVSTADNPETYEEENNSSLNPNAVALGNEGEWDWVIQDNAANNTTYCFRAVSSGGELLGQYDLYPSLITNSAPAAPTLEQPFDNEALASTTPWFQFVSEDPEDNNVTYQIEVNTAADFTGTMKVQAESDSLTFLNDFTNTVTPGDQEPFNSGEEMRYIYSGSTLSNNTTYYWRVRARDGSGSNEWGTWSSTYSFTIDTSVTFTTWRQTTLYQFSNNAHDGTEATSTNDVVLTPPQTNGTTTATSIDFDLKSTGNSWSSLSWNDTETSSDIKYHFEYFDGADWALIPDADLAGNEAGFDTSPVSLLALNTDVFNEIRPYGVLTNLGATPHLLDWTVSWGLAVEAPDLVSLFDNEKTSTTTPIFTFHSSDPQGDDLNYQISLSTSPDFTASTTRTSNVNAGFANIASTTDTWPFKSGDTISFKLQQADALSNGTTYWWRVRAIDPAGGNSWSAWSLKRSFTVDTSVTVSTWFQTTTEQFDTDTLSDIQTTGGGAQITSTVREAFVAYAEGTVQVPRFRIWNGTAWGSELSGASVGDTIRFVEAAAAPTRDEYTIGTQGGTGGINVQIVDGTTDTASNKVSMGNVTGLTQRGYDVAYERTSGDAVAVACSGTEAVYRVWDGVSWSATSSIALAVSDTCQWVKMASDPVSDEIIAVFRDDTLGATDYQALVWNGSSWGNSITMGSQVTANDEGIAIEYEESGDQAVVAVSNGANNNFIYRTWNGAWSGTATLAIGNDFAGGRLARDAGTDNLVMCYTDIDSDIGISRWNGTTFSAFQEFETLGNSLNGRPVTCDFETTSGRDGFIMVPYSDTTLAEYVNWNGTSLSAAQALTTISDSWELRSVRTGDDKILVVAYDDANTEYDFTYWNGSAWSIKEVLEATSIATITPRPIPIDIVARRFPTFTSGSVESTDINFTDGSGIKWDSVIFSKTTPGASTVVIRLEYFNSASSTWDLIPNSALPGNVTTGTTTSPIDISNLDFNTYANLRLKATLQCAGANCPTLNDWTLKWSPGITVSGSAKQFDETTNVTSGTVAIAINGVLQIGKTGTISGGAWSITNLRAFAGDVITVFVSGASNTNKAVAVTVYDGTGNITGLALNERHLSLGSDENPTITNADISQYDNSISGSTDIFYDVTTSGGRHDLTVCSIGTSCFASKLLVKFGTAYRPDSTSSGNVTTRDLQNDGTIVADGNTFFVGGSWKNSYVFTKNNSTVIFTATSSTQTIDSTSATSSAVFNNVTFGQTSGTALWNLLSPLAASGTVSITFGTLSQNGSRAITLSGDLSIGASGIFAKGTASTTFTGTGTNTWTDSSAAGQDMGIVVVDGAAKTVTLGSNVKATNITIGADDTLNAGGANTISVVGNWINNNIFTAQTGTVNFIATSTGKIITPGNSSFFNLTFNGGNGNWAFTTNTVTATNNFTVATGTVTLPTATTTIGGNFDSSTGAFQHNNGTVLFNSSTAGKTIRTATTSAFYDMTFNGSGSWSFGDLNATSSRTVVIVAGTVTMPAGVFAIGGSFDKQGGSFTGNNGVLKFTAASAQTIRFNNSNAANVTFNGIGGTGTWTFVDTNATTTGTVRFENGTTTLPTGYFGVGGSLLVTTPGAFLNNGGTVYFNATATGFSVTPGLSVFRNLIFDSPTGGWAITANATSTGNTTLVRASSFTLASSRILAVQGNFLNSVGGTATTWTGSVLSLYNATTTSIDAKNNLGDQYDTLRVGTSTKVKMWNSSATTTQIDSTGYLYSQNHASSTGSLYIYGSYTGTGNEYWAYSTDFDGAALGTGRQVNVRIASSSIVTLTGSSSIQGLPTASTTIANQGSGFYSLNVTAGTTSAQYFTIASTTPTGLSFSGLNTKVTTFQNGAFELSTPSGGSSISVTSDVINTNPDAQWLYMRFATTTGVTSGFNVTETGVPSASHYWWFKNGYGPLYGEDYDSDPGPGGGNPGYIQFDDSGITVTFSGHVYSDHGQTPIGNSVCENGTTTAKVFVRTNSGLTYSGTCDSSGAFSFPVTLQTSSIVTGYLNTNGGPRAVTITKNVTGDVTNFDLYQNTTIIRQFDNTPTTIADMNFTDSSIDSDIPFTATSSLMVQPNTELYVWTAKSFVPGGDVILQSGGSGDARDGRLYLATSSVFTESGTPYLTIGGGLQIDSGAAFTIGNATTTFIATTTGKGIFSYTPLTLRDVVFTGAGGQWLFNGTSTATTTMNSLTLTAGTIGGIGSIDVQTGGITGGGTIAMVGGIFRMQGTGNFGNVNPWQFRNLILGSTTANTITKTGSATTTINGFLHIPTSSTLNAGSSPWVFFGGGTPFSISGTFNVQTAPFWYTATSSTNITATTYASFFLAPTSSSPTYTMLSGAFTLGTTTIGDATNVVTVSASVNDPTINFTRDFTINSSATFIASDLIDINAGGSWTNNGTFTASGRTVIFDATSIGKTITPGASSFFNLTFNSASGGWTIQGNATSTHNTSLASAASFTLASGRSLEVGGTFTNSVASSSQTWTGSTLYLNSGTSYTMNTKSAGNAAYGTLSVGANTKIRNWNSYQTNTVVNSTGSLYAQNFASSSGKLYIWGAYTHSTGSDYWDYSTDFDGTSLATTSRKVDVFVASSSALAFSGGLLDIIGDPTASTTVQVQGSGAYSLAVSGGTFGAQYYEFRNLTPNGLSLSGTPTVSTLANGDFLMSASNNSLITITSTVIDANPLRVFKYVKFATSTGVVIGTNVTETGSASVGNYWKFNQHYGNLGGEQFDNDAGGDPGYIRWDNSNDHISLSGKVYSDEGTSVSTACDGTTQIVRLKVEGAGSFTASCASGSGLYTFPDVSYNPGDTLTLYLASSSKRSATVSRGPGSNISDMDIYEHRVILRHEDVTPLTIFAIDQFDSGQDSNVPFLATVSATNTLIVEPNTKLIVWTGKSFAPAGNVTVQSGGVGGAVDGTVELYANASFIAAGTQSHSVGGSFLVDSGATFMSANSTVTFTATTTGKTITPNTSAFYNATFNGVGGNWAFSGGFATSTNDFTIATGTVTLPTSQLEVGGSFLNTGGVFQHNNGTVLLTSAATGKNIQVKNSPFYNLNANGAGGTWSFVDSVATTSNDFTILLGAVTAPATLNVGGSFRNSATFVNNNGVVKMTSNVGDKTITTNGSNLYSLSFTGVGGGWAFLDGNATTSRDFTIATGTVTLPSGTIAVGGSFTASSTFASNGGMVRFTATTTGFVVGVATSTFFDLAFDSTAGGWTLFSNATSTRNTSILNAASFTLSTGKTLEVDGIFTNNVGGAPTTWTGSILYLNSGTNYSINARGNTGDNYGQFTLGTNTQVRMWNSSAATATPGTSAYLYSQNNGNVPGSLYIYGTYSPTSGTDYWSAATDFDGTALGAAARAVNVRIATSSSVAYSGATLNMIGTSTATTTIYASGIGNYAFSVAGGILNASYYQFKNMDADGLSLSGAPIITSLSNGDFEMSAASGTMITLTGSVVDANAGLTANAVRMATTSTNLRGFNVYVSTTPGLFWTFTGGYGNLTGERYDADGTSLCGHIRWDDSDCQFVNEAHYRFRNDDGGEGALATTWYDNSWSTRKKVVIVNSNATAYTNIPVKVDVTYDAAMQSDFDDVRFTDSSGTSTVPFWRESTTPFATSTVWVKVASLPANGSATLYMYFGNGGASAADNGANTFPFLDDFEDGDISNYLGDDNQGGTVYFNMSNSTNQSHDGTHSLPGNGATAATPNGLYLTGTQTGTNKTIRWWQYVDVGSPPAPGTNTDDACTLFGIQTPGGSAVTNDYAVCLGNFTLGSIGPRLSIARDTHSRDFGGTIVTMASTSVNWFSAGTGWYEVVTDWISGSPNQINARVYRSDGSLLASVSTSTSLYSSGGIGFSSVNQHGYWDTIMVKPYTAVTPTYHFGSNQQNNGATWKAAEDTPITGLLPNQNVRLRFSIQNTGTPAANRLFTLQYASKGAALNCESVDSSQFEDVPAFNSCISGKAACMASSTQITTLASTSPSLSYPASMGFVAGYVLQDPVNATPAMSLLNNTATELEYTFKITNNATQSAYCFRVNDGGSGGVDLPNYDRVAEASIAYPPILGPINLVDVNNLQNIALIEGATTTVYASTTVTDNNGYADIISATSTIFRSSTTSSASCIDNPNNCYQLSSSSCTFSNCAGNSCTLQCRADLQYFAEPTDAGLYFGLGGWRGVIAVQDTSGFRDTQSTISSSTNVLTLRALQVLTGGLDFGILNIGSNTGTTDATTTTKNTGNSPISINVSGTDLSTVGTSTTIAVGQQKFSTSTFAYGSCSICQFLSGSAANVNVNIAKPTATTSSSTQDIYFGIGIPAHTPATSFQGVNTFTAVAPGS